jgi:hypothetical protein
MLVQAFICLLGMALSILFYSSPEVWQRMLLRVGALPLLTMCSGALLRRSMHTSEEKSSSMQARNSTSAKLFCMEAVFSMLGRLMLLSIGGSDAWMTYLAIVLCGMVDFLVRISRGWQDQLLRRFLFGAKLASRPIRERERHKLNRAWTSSIVNSMIVESAMVIVAGAIQWSFRTRGLNSPSAFFFGHVVKQVSSTCSAQYDLTLLGIIIADVVISLFTLVAADGLTLYVCCIRDKLPLLGYWESLPASWFASTIGSVFTATGIAMGVALNFHSFYYKP